MIVAGIDIGYRSTKAVILENDKKMLAHEENDSLDKAFSNVLEKANLSKDKVMHITATGAGRETVDLAQKVTPDIIASAKGAYYYFPSVRTVFDVGAEQGRAIKCDDNGKVLKFARNEKCAAGSGEFLEYIVNAMEVNIKDAGKLALLSKDQVSINANCAVFAESEVVSLIHSNIAEPDIIQAVLDSLAIRTASLGQRVDCEEDMALVGGLARIEGFLKCMEKHMETKLLVPENPQFVAAVGAALLSAEMVKEGNE